jgi:hypothetical protein
MARAGVGHFPLRWAYASRRAQKARCSELTQKAANEMALFDEARHEARP